MAVNKTLLISCAVMAMGLGLYLSHIEDNKTKSNYPLDGQVLESTSGGTLDLAALKGRRVVINFWASWCPPCVEEMPELNQLYETELKAKQVELIGIAIDSPSNIKDFLAQKPVNYPILIAGLGGTQLAQKLGNSQGGLPYTVILDEDGRFLLQKAGRIHMDEIQTALGTVAQEANPATSR